MPRRSRLDLPGTIHHVCIRGIEGRDIVGSAADARDLLRRFARWSHETKTVTLAWSIPGNHAHFVIVRGELPMAVLMARSTSAYAQGFNWRHERRGHLLMGRYESRAIRDDADLRWMVLYASANAVRHERMTPAALDRSGESSWAGMMGERDPQAFESFQLPLALYGDDPVRARQSLRQALAHAVATQWAPPRAVQLAALVEAECARHGIAREQIHADAPAARAARAAVIRRAVGAREYSWSEIARELRTSRSSVARILRRGK